MLTPPWKLFRHSACSMKPEALTLEPCAQGVARPRDKFHGFLDLRQHDVPL